jgi:hypothetical protein
MPLPRPRCRSAPVPGVMLRRAALIGRVLVSGLLGDAMLQRAAATEAATPGLLPPVSPACISSPFGPRVLANRPLAGTYHNGIDLPAPEGAPVRAVAPGMVVRVQRHGVGGLEMLVQHAGFVGVYSHLGHVAPMVAEGRRTLYGGQVIGTVGRSGAATACTSTSGCCEMVIRSIRRRRWASRRARPAGARLAARPNDASARPGGTPGPNSSGITK